MRKKRGRGPYLLPLKTIMQGKGKKRGCGRAYLPLLQGAGKRRGKGRVYLPPLKGAGRRRRRRMRRKFIGPLLATVGSRLIPLLPTIGKAVLGGAISGGISYGIRNIKP